MNYIVFDLEWNQCPQGKDFELASLPFEIIEIGAVKLGEDLRYLDEFHVLIRPSVYRRLHYQTRRVIGISEKELQKGLYFKKAAAQFFAWCAEKQPESEEEEPYRFCSWGPSDLEELQRNLAHYHMEEKLPGPILYEDVQKLFAIAYERRKDRRALHYAVDYLGIPDEGGFHRALGDARYTAKVMQAIPPDIVSHNYSIDCFQNPKERSDEIRLRYETYEKFISREFPEREDVMKAKDLTDVYCFVCGQKVRRSVAWFSDSNSRNHLAVARCPEHGYVKCKIRVREGKDGGYFCIRTTKMITPEQASEIRRKKADLKLKRRLKRQKEH